MGTTNTLDLNNRVGALKRAISENAEDTHDIENDIYAVMGKMGAKNLVPYPFYETTTTYRGVEWTDNKDGTVTATRVSTGDAISGFKCTGNAFATALKLKAGTYTISGCPSGGSDSKYRINVLKYTNSTNTKIAIDHGNGATFTVTSAEADDCTYGIFCDVAKDYSPSNLTFKPMLRLASITDDTYQPYAKTNRELTDEILTKIPDAPTTDGTYNLSVTVANGTPTYSWVSA